jgi:hypothetical protein
MVATHDIRRWWLPRVDGISLELLWRSEAIARAALLKNKA